MSSALGWAVREGLVERRKPRGGTAMLWRPAGTEPRPERPPVPGVVEAVAAAGGPLTVDDVAEATGRTAASVSTSLAKAAAAGRAARVRRGLYGAAG